MRKIDNLLNEYGESHQTSFNQKVHYICVPAIFFSIIGLFAAIPTGGIFEELLPDVMLPYMHLGTVIIILGLIYYLRLSVSLFIGMIIFSGFVLFGVNALTNLDVAPLWVIMLIIFVIAWIVQFIGHKHEGKKPSFLKDVQFLMIGPAWTMSHLFDALNIRF